MLVSMTLNDVIFSFSCVLFTWLAFLMMMYSHVCFFWIAVTVFAFFNSCFTVTFITIDRSVEKQSTSIDQQLSLSARGNSCASKNF